jgi:inner membrane transporter RhtA
MTADALTAQKPPSIAERAPPHVFFLVSAVFHYLGPSFAVLLFAHIAPLGVAWLRIASAALIFALWRKAVAALRNTLAARPHDRSGARDRPRRDELDLL